MVHALAPSSQWALAPPHVRLLCGESGERLSGPRISSRPTWRPGVGRMSSRSLPPWQGRGLARQSSPT
eukprot:1533970-Alexandrium_andersonii.AAC.1